MHRPLGLSLALALLAAAPIGAIAAERRGPIAASAIKDLDEPAQEKEFHAPAGAETVAAEAWSPVPDMNFAGPVLNWRRRRACFTYPNLSP